MFNRFLRLNAFGLIRVARAYRQAHQNGGLLIHYEFEKTISAEQFVDILRRSTLAERRPVDDRARIEGMLRHANLLVTAWNDELLVGVARSVTDFYYCCYLSDLAVDKAIQGKGVGRELIQHTREQLDPRCKIILLSAPAATGFYPHIGFTRHDQAWILKSSDPLI